MGDIVIGGKLLQVAISIGNTNRTDVIPLRKKHLQHHLAVLAEGFCFSGDLHALCDACRAGREQSARTLDLDEAEASGSNRIQAI